jgi:hypothetical protein
LGSTEYVEKRKMTGMDAKQRISKIKFAVALFPVTVGLVFLLRSQWWYLGLIPAIIAGVLWIALLLPERKPTNITPQGLAVKLEAHLLGTEGRWDWDDLTSLRVADPKLAVLIGTLVKFDKLTPMERRKEFVDVIAALKRGEIPGVEPE